MHYAVIMRVDDTFENSFIPLITLLLTENIENSFIPVLLNLQEVKLALDAWLRVKLRITYFPHFSPP